MPTSTNGAESFHSTYNKDHTKAHPNIHATAQALLEVQGETYVAIRTVRAGIKATRRPLTEEINELTLQAFKDLKDGKMLLLDYLYYVGNLNYSMRKHIVIVDQEGEEDEEEL